MHFFSHHEPPLFSTIYSGCTVHKIQLWSGGEGRVDTNYYLLSVESLETDTGRLETGEVLQAFFDEKNLVV